MITHRLNRKVLACLLTVLLLLGNTPVAVPVGALGVDRTAASFTDLQNYVGEFNYGSDDMTITVDTSGNGLAITAGLTINNTNGNILTITGEPLIRATTEHLFRVNGGTLRFKNITLDGQRTSYTSNQTSLVYVNSGTFITEAGAVLTNNVNIASSNGYGGGVFVNGGSFIMNGGEISGNIADARGGGVFIGGVTSTASAFIMYDGEISGNHVTSTSTNTGGGGVCVSNANSTFDMYGGTIAGNTAVYRGGGINIISSSVFTLYGGVIAGNAATGTAVNCGGGGVFISSSTFEMKGGTIAENHAALNGGGVAISGGAVFTMTDGEVTLNTAANAGSGIHVNGSTYTMTGGLVFGRGAALSAVIFPGTWAPESSGNGVAIAWSGTDGTVYLQNTDDDLFYLPAGAGVFWSTRITDDGITYAYNGNEGFIPLYVTVTDITLAKEDLVYSMPINHIYNGAPQGIGTVTPPSRFNAVTGGTLTVKYNGSTALPVEAGTYTVTAEITGGTVYNPVLLTLGSYTINPKELTGLAGIAAVPDKVYDGTAAATVSIIPGAANGLIGADSVTVNVTAAFADKTVGSGKAVTVTAWNLSGTGAHNYSLPINLPAGLTADITQKGLTITGVTATDREYDTTTAVMLTGGTLNGAVIGDSVNFNLNGGTVTEAGVGSGKAVTTAITLTGADAGNYTLTQPAVTVNIMPIALSGFITITESVNNGIFGTIDGGDVLSVDLSGLLPVGAAIEYQWYLDNSPAGTGSTYTVPMNAAGAVITVAVTGTGNYTGSVTSAPVDVGDSYLAGTASISGGDTVGSVITFEGSLLAGTYQVVWMRDGVDIPLENGMTYTVQTDDLAHTITARAAGTGSYTGTITASGSIYIPPELPGVPQNVTAAAGDGQAALSWTAPISDGGSAILRYEVSADNGLSWVSAGINTSYTFTGLTNGSSYTLKVRAVNITGDGPEAWDIAMPAAAEFTVTFVSNGGTAVPGQQVTAGQPAARPPAPTRRGYTFTGWYTDTGCTIGYVFTALVTNNISLYAGWARNSVTGGDDGTTGGDDGATAEAYVNGYLDGTFRPDAGITRAEAAQLLYNLSTHDKQVSRAVFTDVAGGKWYGGAVTYLTGTGVITGYPDGTFRPENTITRAEFTTLVVRFMGLAGEGVSAFPDIAETHWASSYTATAERQGLLSGYPDGTVHPEAAVTRAEAVVILNNMLGRSTERVLFAGLQMPFSDVPGSHWAWSNIMAAAVEHITP